VHDDTAEIHEDLTAFRRELRRHSQVARKLPRTEDKVLACWTARTPRSRAAR
jgi:hypothetical protein